MKTTDYRILTDDCAGDLSAQVKAAIAEGWQPIGGVALAFTTGKMLYESEESYFPTFAQAMIKPEAAALYTEKQLNAAFLAGLKQAGEIISKEVTEILQKQLPIIGRKRKEK